MSTATASVVIAIIVGLPAIIAAVSAYQAAARIGKTEAKVDEVALQIDGRMDEILELSKKLAHAAGIIEGVAQEKASQASKGKP